MIMIWIENHLILLGLVAVLLGVGLGALLTATHGRVDRAPLVTPRRSGRPQARRTTIS
jgi:hypothetical protein